MNKTTLFFLGGAALGASITAVTMTSGVFGSAAESGVSGSHHQQGSMQEQIQNLSKIAENLSVTAQVLKNSAETLASRALPITLAKSSQPLPAKSVATTTGDAMQVSMAKDNAAQPATDPVQPTPKQIDQFTSIKTKLYAAANNNTAHLAELVQQANDLTPEQRQELTTEAMGMIKRGELKPEQFVRLPDSRSGK